MLICYKCTVNFDILDDLVKHLKYSHFLTSSDTLQCKQNGCNQLFSSLKSFKVHIKKVHKHTNPSAEIVHSSIHSNNLEINSTYSTIPTNETNITIDNAEILAPFNLTRSLNELKEKALHFSLQFHAEDSMTRNDVLSIQKHVTILCSSISKVLNSCLAHSKPENTLQEDVSSVLEFCNNPFAEISTEHRFFKNLRELNLYKDSVSHELGNHVTSRVVKGNPTLVGKTFSAYFMPLQFQLKTFFERPEVLTLTLKNTKDLMSKNTICNFINGESYTNKLKYFAGKTVIPIFLYFDDYGINNPLGSHSTSVLAGYYSFPTVPQYLLSQLQFIFNVAFIKSNDYKQFGNDISFYHLIEELMFLEKEGLSLNTPEETIKVHFVLGAVLGDNLGLNTILGFARSFNSSSFCRVCKRTKLQTKKDCIQIDESLRNEKNYTEDLTKNKPEETGVRENCTFNRIPSFHVIDNFVLDVMHDFFEGVCHYDISNILLSLIQQNIISVDVLNSRKNLFQYGETEVGYVSTSNIDENRLKSYKLKMSARETWTFIHFLPLMLGDLIPKTNRPWKLLCLLLQVLEKVLLPEFNEKDINTLTTLIKEHNELYIKLYGDLKPKHHFLVHYPTLIRKCGPPKFLWSLRFEAKHQSSKVYSNNTSSRINIPYTLSIKAGLKYAKFLIDFNQGFSPEYSLDNKELLNVDHIIFSQINLTHTQKVQLEQASISHSGTYRGKKYKNNLYLTAVENDQIKLYKIANLVELCQNSLYILVNEIELKGFDYHFQSFEVGQYLTDLYLKPIEYFTSPPLHLYTSNNGKVYLRNKFL